MYIYSNNSTHLHVSVTSNRNTKASGGHSKLAHDHAIILSSGNHNISHDIQAHILRDSH